MQQGTLYTVKDIARKLSVTERTVYNWINQGQLHAIKVAGNQWRISSESLSDFLDAGETIATQHVKDQERALLDQSLKAAKKKAH